MRRAKHTILAVGCVGLIAASAGILTVTAQPSSPGSDDPFAYLPATLSVGATLRDFRAFTDGGHPDFEHWMGTTRIGMVRADLGADGKPVLANSYGSDIKTEYKDKDGQNINPAIFDASKGDTKGVTVAASEPRIESAESFDQWYRDLPGVNVSKPLALTLHRKPNSNAYIFDSDTDEPWKTLGGFFAYDGDGYGNYQAWPHNFHFTTEVVSEFTFEKGKGHVFTFTGDDDVWVFIGGKLVIDLGGIHEKRIQTVELDRLDWLQDGTTYSFHIFHAERHTRESNFRMETTILLRPINPPPTTGLYD